MRKRIYVLFTITLCLILIFSASCKKKDPGMRGQQPVSVLVEKPSIGRLDNYLDLSAEIVAPKQVYISSDVPGKVSQILKYEGSFVKRGDTIALIDRFVIGANYAKAPARTPISGYVTSTTATIGQSINAGTPIASVADMKNLELYIYVPERSVGTIKLGQKVNLRVPSSAGHEFQAVITKHDLSVDPKTRTLLAKAYIENKDNVLLPGMFSDVSILVDSAENAFIIPNSAVLTETGKNYVYVVKESVPKIADVAVSKEKPKKKKKDDEKPQNLSVANLQEVDVIFSYRDKVAVRSGITENDEIVMFGREFLKNGSPVIPIRENKDKSFTSEN